MASGHVNRANKAEHMAAPHRICDVKIFLANSEPSTHRPFSEVQVGAQKIRSQAFSRQQKLRSLCPMGNRKGVHKPLAF